MAHMSQEFTEFLELFGCWGSHSKTTYTVILQWILCLFIFCQHFVVVSSVYYRADCGEGEEMCWFSLLGLPPPALATDTGINHVICTQALQHTVCYFHTKQKGNSKMSISAQLPHSDISPLTYIDDMLHVYWKLKQVSLCLINFFHSVAVAMSAPQCQCQPQHWRQRNFAFTCYLKFFFPLS